MMMFKMKLLNRLVLGASAGPFLFGILIFTLIFVAGDLLFQAASLIINNGVSLGVVTRLFFYRLPEVVAMTLPMSSLLSTLLGMSTLAGGSELIALKSLGVPFTRVLRPIIAASLLISVGALTFNETIVPFTSMAADRLMKYEIMKNQASAVQEKVFIRDNGDDGLRRVVYVDELNTGEGVMSGIMMNEFRENRLVRTLTAMRGIWQDGKWWIEDGRIYDISTEGEVSLLLRFERQVLALNMSPDQLKLSTRRPVDMSAHELWAYIRRAGAVGTDLSKLWVMFHLKLGVPWACVIMAVLGAGFGASRKGRGGSGMSFGISVVIVFAYYVVMSMCRALGEAGAIPPWTAGWGPNIVFLIVALFFASRVDKV